MNTLTNYLCLYCVYLPLGSSQTQRWKPFHVHLVQLSKGFIELKPICGFIPAKQARPIKSKLQEFVFAPITSPLVSNFLISCNRKKLKRPVFAVSMLINMFSTLNIKILYKYSSDHVSAQIEA